MPRSKKRARQRISGKDVKLARKYFGGKEHSWLKKDSYKWNGSQVGWAKRWAKQIKKLEHYNAENRPNKYQFVKIGKAEKRLAGSRKRTLQNLPQTALSTPNGAFVLLPKGGKARWRGKRFIGEDRKQILEETIHVQKGASPEEAIEILRDAVEILKETEGKIKVIGIIAIWGEFRGHRIRSVEGWEEELTQEQYVSDLVEQGILTGWVIKYIRKF